MSEMSSCPGRGARPIWGLTRWAGLLLLLLSTTLWGCASGPARDPRDPLEPFNRSMYRFNTAVDDAVVKPVATAYRDVTPTPVRTAVGNFFGNLSDIWSALNTALQLRVEDTVVNVMRVGINTFFGLGGVLDVASEMNLERKAADFGQTLGRWGVPSGPYLVLPLMGPSTVRDTLASGVERNGDLVWDVDHIPSRNSLLGLRLVDKRAQLLRASSVLDDAALDPYSFTRDVFLQRRQSLIESKPNREEE